MNDEQLLEAAARAAGLDYMPQCGAINVRGIPTNWNPLTDDGDALRLAVALRLVVHVWDDGSDVSVAKTLTDGEDPAPDSNAWHSAQTHACGDSQDAAARRAIVRAAAALAG